jgi:hypothetical protein
MLYSYWVILLLKLYTITAAAKMWEVICLFSAL